MKNIYAYFNDVLEPSIPMDSPEYIKSELMKKLPTTLRTHQDMQVVTLRAWIMTVGNRGLEKKRIKL